MRDEAHLQGGQDSGAGEQVARGAAHGSVDLRALGDLGVQGGQRSSLGGPGSCALVLHPKVQQVRLALRHRLLPARAEASRQTIF